MADTAVKGNPEAADGGAPDAKHRWEFIRKVYFHLSLQFLLAAAVVYIVIVLNPTLLFFTSHPAVVSVIVFSILCIVSVASVRWSHKHPWNFFLITIFTVYFSLITGFICIYMKDKVALEFSILIAAVMILLTMYTFWATWRKYDDFTVLKPFLCSVIFVALLFTIIQIFLPQGKFVNALLFGALATILYSTMIIYYTRLTVTIYFYDDKWMEAVVDLY
ncbi:unnamed protein product, partial [Cuscuta epithymum]